MEHSKAIRPELLLLIAACTSAIPAAMGYGLLNEAIENGNYDNPLDLTFLYSIAFLTAHAFNMALLARLSLGQFSSFKLELLVVVCFFLSLLGPVVSVALSFTVYTILPDLLRQFLEVSQFPLLFWLATAYSFKLILWKRLPVNFIPLLVCSGLLTFGVMGLCLLGVPGFFTLLEGVVFIYLCLAIPSLAITAYFILYQQIINPVSAQLETTT
ncbi:hypothetical protein [Lacunimicrobium album]